MSSKQFSVQRVPDVEAARQVGLPDVTECSSCQTRLRLFSETMVGCVECSTILCKACFASVPHPHVTWRKAEGTAAASSSATAPGHSAPLDPAAPPTTTTVAMASHSQLHLLTTRAQLEKYNMQASFSCTGCLRMGLRVTRELRFHCRMCPSFDYCASCFANAKHHHDAWFKVDLRALGAASFRPVTRADLGVPSQVFVCALCQAPRNIAQTALYRCTVCNADVCDDCVEAGKAAAQHGHVGEAPPAAAKGARWYFCNVEEPQKTANNSDPAGTGGGSSDCVICMERPRSQLFVPCCHMVCCGQCAQEMKARNQCPVCMQPVHSVLPVIVS